MTDLDGNIAMVNGEPDQDVLNDFFTVEAPVEQEEESIQPNAVLKREDLGGGVYTTTTNSATRKGYHKHWYYPRRSTSLEAESSNTSVVTKREHPAPPEVIDLSQSQDTIDQYDAVADKSEESSATTETSDTDSSRSLKRLYDSASDDNSDDGTQQAKKRCGHDVEVEPYLTRSRRLSRTSNPSTKSSKRQTTPSHNGQEGKVLEENIYGFSLGASTSSPIDTEKRSNRSPKRPRDEEYDAEEELSSEDNRSPRKMHRKIGIASPSAETKDLTVSTELPAEKKASATALVKAKSVSPPRICRKVSKIRKATAAPL
ncbi:hypothetical protein CPB84DRAFT_1848067 [Gymnopilus junonius]|uniref:Uncharacterized protein n=1 Tax=Gymnopilus junonius TaxID=109634 RepID=A0A9P5NIY4_GYMJU|nr:hypothetical protein CPB84DRAFT_1848067 [Gymnopilus junonius]